MPQLYFCLIVGTFVISLLLTFVHEEFMGIYYRFIDFIASLETRLLRQ